MAVIHDATLTPTKAALLAEWLPTRSWADGATEPEQIGAYRFDDPAGEVGIETFLVRAGERVLHVPVTYRARTLFGADAHLIGVAEHSVLGTRYVYDGCGDPVYLTALATAILTGGEQAPVVVTRGGLEVPREPTVWVRGTGPADTDVPRFGSTPISDDGATTTIRAAGVELVVLREPDAIEAANRPALTGTWAGHDEPALLAVVDESA